MELPGWDLGGAGMRGNRMSPHTTHLAVPAGRGVLGGAAFPAEFPRGVVELGEDGLGEVGMPPGQLEQEPGAGNERAEQAAKRSSCADSAEQTLAVCSKSCREGAGPVQEPSAP